MADRRSPGSVAALRAVLEGRVTGRLGVVVVLFEDVPEDGGPATVQVLSPSAENPAAATGLVIEAARRITQYLRWG
jgi:hypothetical protein